METQTNQNGPSEENIEQITKIGSAKAFLWDLFLIFVIALAVIVPFRTFVAEPFVVSGTSMVPNFHHRDYLIIDRLTYRLGEPKRGDVVVLRFPKDPSQFYIKRVIGLPGEKVALKAGNVHIYNSEHPEGFKLDEEYLKNDLETLGRPDAITLGTDEYYVLGDNRTQSSDSRVWGILPREEIVGRVWLRAWPAKDFQMIKTPAYLEAGA